MKGVLLAGGQGTRMRPVTLTVNKHLFPVYNRPMLFYPLQTLLKAGLKEVMIVTSPEHLSAIQSVVDHGKREGLFGDAQISYGLQEKPNGLAAALCVARDFVAGDSCALIFGDNIIDDDLTPHFQSFEEGALIFLKEVERPQDFGVPRMRGNLVLEIIEKPVNPPSKFAAIGAYAFDNSVFARHEKQKPSQRGEYEITDLLNTYIPDNKLKAVELSGAWFDVGTFDRLHEAAAHIRAKLSESNHDQNI